MSQYIKANQLLSVCSFLDSRFNKKLTEEDKRIAIEFLKKELSALEDNSEDGASFTEPCTKRFAWSRDGPEEMPTNISMQEGHTGN